jgi:serine/threonine-protein kinase RsbW
MRFCDKSVKPFGDMILEMAVPSQLSLKTPLVLRMVSELVKRGCLPSTGNQLAELAIDEAMTNAMVHGNRLAPTKKVRVSLFADDKRWGAIIEDEGDGFDPEGLPKADSIDDILREEGRGIILMDGYLDDLVYAGKGNRVMLVRHREAEAEQAAPVAAAPEAPELPEEDGPVSVTQEGDVVVAEMREPRLAQDNLDAMRAALTELAVSSRALVLDMQRVTYISSPGIGLLVSLLKLVTSHKGVLVLAAVQPLVRDVLSATQLDKLLALSPDRARAVASARKRLEEA